MYRDFVNAIREGPPPEMSLERAIEDQRLMDRIYATLDRRVSAAGQETTGVGPVSAARD
jgi:predicted dehydrogenase